VAGFALRGFLGCCGRSVGGAESCVLIPRGKEGSGMPIRFVLPVELPLKKEDRP